MELKNYQQDVLQDIADYIDTLRETPQLSTAFHRYWMKRGVTPQSDKTLCPYQNITPGVPNVTIKVPTAGGKTFIACNAIDTILRYVPEGRPQVVVWFVPSDAILRQTYANLANPQHPYRQRIDSLFGSAVKVYGKEQLLAGEDFNPITVANNLSIMVLSIQSFATSAADKRRVYSMNSQLMPFVSTYEASDPHVKEAEESSLIQVIAHLRPLIVVDESHNYGSDLRISALQDLNPCFVLNLTATPREQSNIISFVGAGRLKKENMVKLPVIVYHAQDHNEVINKAIALRQNLEQMAIEEEQQGGDYIRPIVLFQAQPRSDDDSVTFDKLKATLVSAGIPEEQVKIKTSNKDELKGLDLMSRQCPVRFIITVNALKEGWDCPFAYVLASIANRSSRIDVEQILGRILRQPYTRKHGSQFLNMSYVFSSSADFNATIDSIVESLRMAGYSRHDYRVGSSELKPTSTPAPEAPALPFTPAEDSAPEQEEALDIQPYEIHVPSTDAAFASESDVSTLLTQAASEGEAYESHIEEAPNDDLPEEVMPQVNKYEIRKEHRSLLDDIRLPRFVEMVSDGGLFGGEHEEEVTPQSLLADFNLAKADRNIDFTVNTAADAKRIDLDEGDDDNATAFSFKESQALLLQKFFTNTTDKTALIHQLSPTIEKALNTDNTLASGQLHSYVEGVLEAEDVPKLQSLGKNIYATISAFRDKLKKLKTEYQKEVFKKKLLSQRIFLKENYAYPEEIKLTRAKAPGIAKKMYQEEEGAFNDFERDVIGKIIDLDCVRCWHRNPPRSEGSFSINGYVNAYPDFIVTLKNGITVLVETKGGHLDGSDSQEKLAIGRQWADKAGPKFAYFMVFDNNKIDGAVTLAEFIEALNELGSRI